ncbi:papain-like cysteine protease family protein [Rhizobium leguminosarum]|uniref:papain-like cysteine protease family protein n=1 Tax=Rhizobium leguminosarum TaxID=384 RepID=UPI0024A9112B|nr:papain-like cysteine protease family protein [Rhizobium leguminosarum]MDI5929049.1 papain-like cysteine protease family protein [Rhizobium leguminosarum]
MNTSNDIYKTMEQRIRAAAGKTLPFSMQHQVKSNWCWAATSSSVSKFFNGSSTWSQCRIASSILSQKCCDELGYGSPCNVTNTLDDALGVVGCFHHMTDVSENFSVVKTELSAGRPVCIRVEWYLSGNGHFLAIYGWSIAADGTEMYEVDDPIYSQRSISHSDLVRRYLRKGRWTHTYFVRGRAAANAAGGGFRDPLATGA